MSKLKLDNQLITDEFFDECRIIGIVAPVKDYSFTWLINQQLKYGFRLNINLEIRWMKKARNYYFSIFEYAAPASFRVHYLYNNHCDGEYLLPEFKHLDFIWIIKHDYVSNDELQLLIQQIKSLPVVQLVTELQPDKIKNKQQLIF